MFRYMAAAFIIAGILSMCRPSPAAQVERSEAAEAINALASDLAAKLISGDENVCFSPYSISTAFAMVYAGAVGTTAEEMEDALHFGSGIHESNAELVRSFADNPDEAGTLLIANSVWPRKEFRFRREYRDLIERAYRSEINTQDYEGDKERACANINSWVSDRTNGMIEGIVHPSSVSPQTAMILVNAVWFKAPWRDAFDEADTAIEKFHARSGDRDVRMMKRTGPFFWREGEGYRAIEVPYRYGVFSMTIILPDEDVDDARAVSLIAREAARTDDAQYLRRRVDLWLPKFRIESSFGLNDIVQDLGVRTAFIPGDADLSGMNGARDLFISDSVHKAVIDVDEEGTEAAAATAMTIMTTSVMEPEEIVEFHADRPFAYIVRDTGTGAVLFMGYVAAP